MEAAPSSPRCNDLTLRFHAAIRDMYVNYADRDSCRELDFRDLAQFERGQVPEVAPLFGGHIYEALPCIRGEVALLEGMIQWTTDAARKRAKLSHKQLEQDSVDIYGLGAFLLCKETASAEIYPALCRIMRDMYKSAIYANKCSMALVSLAGLHTSLQKLVERRIGKRRKRLSPSMVEFEEALLTLVKGKNQREVGVFVRCLTDLRCCMFEAEACVDRILERKHDKKDSFQYALEELGCLQQAILQLSINVALVVPAWEYVFHECL